jgi:glycosyltransferase involved in cell wall biosynthesis
VVYDLLPLFFPNAFPQTVDRLHAEWLKQIGKYDGIFCISKAVADDFEAWAKENMPELSPNFKVNWFHLGADIENSAPSKGMPDNAGEILEKISANISFVTIGTIEPRKAYAQMLKAFELLWAKGHKINFVIIGKHGWLMDDFANNLPAHPEFNHRLFWLNGISDEYLENVYKTSTCMLLASEGEGFGLPLIEAASRKVPIIARDIPVFKEVAGDCAYYFKGNTPEELAAAIESWLILHNTGSHPPSEGMKWLTWKESTNSLLENLLQPERKQTATKV